MNKAFIISIFILPYFANAINYKINSSSTNSISYIDVDSIKMEKINKQYTYVNYNKKTIDYVSDRNSSIINYYLNQANVLQQNKCCNNWTKSCQNYLDLENNKNSQIGKITKDICLLKIGSKVISLMSVQKGEVYDINNDIVYLSLNASSMQEKIYLNDNILLGTVKVESKSKFNINDAINLNELCKELVEQKQDINACGTPSPITFFDQYILPKIQFMHDTN